MNARLFQFRYSAERDVVELFLKVSIGAAGAPTVILNKQFSASAPASIVRNSAGNYSINLRSSANVLLDCIATQQLAGATALSAPIMKVQSEQVNSVSAPSLIVQFFSDAGAVADINNGAVLMLRVTVRNAST